MKLQTSPLGVHPLNLGKSDICHPYRLPHKLTILVHRFVNGTYITARKQIEDLIGLEEYYKIEEETVEKMYKKENAKKKR